MIYERAVDCTGLPNEVAGDRNSSFLDIQIQKPKDCLVILIK